jgi:hypothetical protein
MYPATIPQTAAARQRLVQGVEKSPRRPRPWPSPAVIPAKAGIHAFLLDGQCIPPHAPLAVIPAEAIISMVGGTQRKAWAPAFAGATEGGHHSSAVDRSGYSVLPCLSGAVAVSYWRL